MESKQNCQWLLNQPKELNWKFNQNYWSIITHQFRGGELFFNSAYNDKILTKVLVMKIKLISRSLSFNNNKNPPLPTLLYPPSPCPTIPTLLDPLSPTLLSLPYPTLPYHTIPTFPILPSSPLLYLASPTLLLLPSPSLPSQPFHPSLLLLSPTPMGS